MSLLMQANRSFYLEELFNNFIQKNNSFILKNDLIAHW